MSTDTTPLDLDKVQAEIELARRHLDSNDANYAAGVLTPCALLLLDEARHLRAELDAERDNVEEATRFANMVRRHRERLQRELGGARAERDALRAQVEAAQRVVDAARARVQILRDSHGDGAYRAEWATRSVAADDALAAAVDALPVVGAAPLVSAGAAATPHSCDQGHAEAQRVLDAAKAWRSDRTRASGADFYRICQSLVAAVDAYTALPETACTGLTARWCPTHGDCTCPANPDRPDTHLHSDPWCRLHGTDSPHAALPEEANRG